MKTVHIYERGCGWPQEGGFYAMSLNSFVHCTDLPSQLPVCDCCGLQLKFSRALQYVPDGYLAMIRQNCACVRNVVTYCDWVGSDYTTEDFIREVRAQGASRRLRPSEAAKIKPGNQLLAVKDGWIIAILPVTSIRYYVKPDDTSELIERLEAEGIEVCKMQRVEIIQHELF
jgi:hypothetical protein